MSFSQAVVTAVLRTLVRATVDERAHVVLRTRDTARAQALGRWLAQAHGSSRTVIASPTAHADVEVRLPVRMQWPLPQTVTSRRAERGLAGAVPVFHLSGMSPSPLSHDSH